MEKFLNLYNTTSAFEGDSEILDAKEHYVAETLDDDMAHFKEYKVELPVKPIESSLAADICIVDNGGNKYIVDGTTYSTDLFPLEQYTPIGVVVVPASHTDDGTARVMSLAAMNCNTPDVGSTEGHTNIYWGGYGSDISTLDNKTVYPCISTDLREVTAETQTIVEWSNINSYPCYLPSDYFNSYPNPYDEGTYYRTGTTSSTYHAGPSPYLTGGLKNEIYHDTSNTASVLADMDGKSNTEKILAVDNGGSTDWQTASTITNADRTETIHPAAQCSWRYHTVGTNQGDWYLPSAGELGYLASRWKVINNSIDKLVSSGVEALVLPVNGYWWSSTEYSSDYAVYLSFYSDYAGLYNYNKNLNFYVRAFLAV